MKLFLKSKKINCNATAEYEVEAKIFTVLKGSVVSGSISNSEKFRSTKTIEKARKGVIKNNVLTEDVVFKSPSMAANFVTGNSKNGLIAWKNSEGKNLRQVLAEIRLMDEPALKIDRRPSAPGKPV